MTRSDHQQCEERNKAISDHHAALASLHKAAAEHHRKMGAAGTGGAVSGGAGAVRPPGSQYGESNFFESVHAGGDFYKNLGTNLDEAERARSGPQPLGASHGVIQATKRLLCR